MNLFVTGSNGYIGRNFINFDRIIMINLFYRHNKFTSSSSYSLEDN